VSRAVKRSSKRWLPALAALALSGAGCSLVWTPIVDPDGGPPDADIDAGVDAYVEPPIDAGTDAFGSDAWMPPPEECTGGEDEDEDGFTDCNDSDCLGTDACCSAATGLVEEVAFTTGTPDTWFPRGWSPRYVDSEDRTYFDFTGSPGSIARTVCTPLAQGARISFVLAGGGASAASFGFVLSPAAEPGPGGFLDELAFRVDQRMEARVTRAGISVPLEASCRGGDAGVPLDAGRIDTVALSGAAGAVVTVDLRPGVASGASALLATISVQNLAGPCMAQTPIVRDLPILVADLIRTTDGPGTCEDNPGLYPVFEGSGPGVFALAAERPDASPLLRIRTLECGSPGVFSPPDLRFDATDVTTGGFAAGGVGAPDLAYDSVATTPNWKLLVDGSMEERSTELFQRLTTRVGLARGTVVGAQTFPTLWMPAPISPAELGMGNVREPSFRALRTDDLSVVFAEESSDPGQFDLFRATIDRVGSRLSAARAVRLHDPRRTDAGVDDDAGMPAPLCESLREPTAIPVYGATTEVGDWIFARCDVGSRSRLLLLESDTDGTRVLSADVLGGHPLGDRVIATDALVRSTGFLAVWVLARGSDGRAELHLFVDEHARHGRAPDLRPYSGNPVLREGDRLLGDCPDGSECRITSFTVATLEERPRDQLRFLFATSRAGGVHELVAAEQPALRGLDAP
jgi:hypothetical protein